MANQCYLSATRCLGTGPTTVYVPQAVAMRTNPTIFYFKYNGSCYSVNPAGNIVDPPPPSTAPFVGAISAHYANCNICMQVCSVMPPAISFCPGTAGNQIMKGYSVPNGTWSATVTCSVDDYVTVTPTSGTADANGNFSFTINYNPVGAGNAETCTVTVIVEGCQNTIVTVDINPVPTSCPSGLATSYTVGWGPVTEWAGNTFPVCGSCNNCYNPSGPQPPASGNWYGTFSWASPCYWGATVSNGCWGGVQIYGAPILNLNGSEWLLQFGEIFSCSGCSVAGIGYVKSCGSTPKGIYTASDPSGVPQTLYVY